MVRDIMKELMIIVCFLSLSCGTKKVVRTEIFDQSVDIHEPGKCYYSIRNNNSDEWTYRPSVLLEIEDPIYITKVKSFKDSELLANHPNQNTISILTRKAHMSYQFGICQLEELNYKRDAEYAYCIMHYAYHTFPYHVLHHVTT